MTTAEGSYSEAEQVLEDYTSSDDDESTIDPSQLQMHIIWDIDNSPTPFFNEDDMNLEAQVFYSDVPLHASVDALSPLSQDDDVGEGKLSVRACASADAASKEEDITGEEMLLGADSAESVATSAVEPPSMTRCNWDLNYKAKMNFE
jgi:hypothetical protein